MNKTPYAKSQAIDRTEYERHIKRESRPPRRGGSFFYGLLGVVVGALLVWLLIPNGNATNKLLDEKNNVMQEERLSVDINTDITTVVESVTDAVVGVTNLQTVRDFWSSSETTKETGTGSGVIYKKQDGKAYIVTNHHVVEGAQELDITFDDGTKAKDVSLAVICGQTWRSLKSMQRM